MSGLEAIIVCAKYGVAGFMYEFFLKGARRAPFKKNSYPD